MTFAAADLFLLPRPATLFGVGTDLLPGVDPDARDRKNDEIRTRARKALIDSTASLACLYLLTSAKEDDGTPALSPDERREASDRLLGLYALTHPRECVRLGELFAACDPDAPRDSLFFRGEADGGFVRSGPDYDYRREIREWLADPLFDGLRERIPFETE